MIRIKNLDLNIVKVIDHAFPPTAAAAACGSNSRISLALQECKQLRVI